MSKEQNSKQMSLLEDSHANHSALQENKKEQTTTAISGQKCLDSLKKLNQNSLLGRMCKELLTSKTAWCSDRCSTIWKVKASKSNVFLFQLQASVLGTKETESGSSDIQKQTDYSKLYPTPNARDWKDTMNKVPPSVGKTRGHSLGQRIAADRVKMYPTPQLDDGKNVNPSPKRRMTLAKHVKMYPTPTVDCEEGGQQSERVERTKSGAFILRKKNKPESTFGAKLSDAMLFLEKKRGGRLNPLFVEFLMGFPMNWTKTDLTESKLSETQSSHKLQENLDLPSKKFYRTPTAMDKGDNSFKYAAKILKGKTNRAQSKEPVQKTLSMDVAMEHLKNNKHLIEAYDEKFKTRPYLPPKEEFIKYLKINLDRKKLIEDNVVKKTTIEHWFRSDHCFSYPIIQDWNLIKPYLKELKYDYQMTFEIESDWE